MKLRLTVRDLEPGDLADLDAAAAGDCDRVGCDRIDNAGDLDHGSGIQHCITFYLLVIPIRHGNCKPTRGEAS